MSTDSSEAALEFYIRRALWLGPYLANWGLPEWRIGRLFWLVPIFASERADIIENGLDCFDELVERKGVSLVDVFRDLPPPA